MSHDHTNGAFGVEPLPVREIANRLRRQRSQDEINRRIARSMIDRMWKGETIRLAIPTDKDSPAHGVLGELLNAFNEHLNLKTGENPVYRYLDDHNEREKKPPTYFWMWVRQQALDEYRAWCAAEQTEQTEQTEQVAQAS